MGILEMILVIIGILFIIISFLMNTRNFQSAILFKVVPFLCGCYCVFYAVYSSGIIKVNI